MRGTIVAFVAGVAFALGLALAGMTDPAKVLAFLDVAGAWDPSLAFVMAGGIAVYAPAQRWIARRGQTWLPGRLQLPSRRTIDARLVAGAILFGVGWGLVGYCPGPAVVATMTFAPSAEVFVAAMLAGMGVFSWWTARRRAR